MNRPNFDFPAPEDAVERRQHFGTDKVRDSRPLIGEGSEYEPMESRPVIAAGGAPADASHYAADTTGECFVSVAAAHSHSRAI
jgi:hypothetical protein